jgi:type IV pilus assembly protein PilV
MIKNPLSKQRGVLMLEALIGILIFSIGVLALVAMQATAISQTTDARYRSEAAFQADKMIGAIWANRGNNVSALASSWAYEVGGGAAPILPNATGANAPTVVVAGNQVTVTVYWQAPGASTRSNHVAIAYLDFNP